MKIYTSITIDIATGVVLDSKSYEYNGAVELCCGATDAQNQVQQQQQSLFTQMTQQAQQVFGASSQVFKQLYNTFAPTVAAGPSQKGFSPAEESNLKSAAITNSGQAYANAKSAVGNAVAAQGGGNNASLQTGVGTGVNLSLAESAAQNESGQLNQINEDNYETGRKNYDTAVAGLEGSTNVFNPATQAGDAATSAGKASADTANTIAQDNNSWLQSVTGALGGIASTATGGFMKNLGSGTKSSGSSSSD